MDDHVKDKLIDLSNLILENTKSELSFFKLVNGLHELHRSYIEFSKKSKCHNQDDILESFSKEVNQKLSGKVVTKISLLKNYCPAEEYHKKYLEKR